MAAGGKKKVKEIFPPALFDEAPIVFTSSHCVYELKASTVPFTIPENTWIIETQQLGDLCLTSIDMPLWTLIQPPNREVLKYYIGGQYDIADLDEEEMEMAAIIQYLNIYGPGDKCFSRNITIGGGSTELGGVRAGSRRVYDSMGFYLFPNLPEGDATPFPRSFPQNRIFEPMRTAFIFDQYKSINYEEFIKMTYTAHPELRDGCIFVFSCCAEAWNKDALDADEAVNEDTPEFRAKLAEVEASHTAQRMKLTAINPNSYEKSGAAGLVMTGAPLEATMAAKLPGGAAAARAAGGEGPAFRTRGVLEGSRVPEVFHDSAWRKEYTAYRTRSNSSAILERDYEGAPHPRAPEQPEGTHVVFKQKGSSKQQLFIKGNMFLTPEQIAAYRKKHPGIHLFELVGADFRPLAGGTRRRRGTRRRHAKNRKTRRKHL